MFAAQLSAGHEAITSPMTFVATANAVLYQSAVPVFADVSPDTLNLDPSVIARHITLRTKAMVVVDYAGHPADLDALLELARQHGLVVIEDACHALGAEYRGRRIGGISHLSVFSFHPVKHLATGEGGMVTTDSADMAQRLRLFRNHGITTDARQRHAAGQWFYEMRVLGFNYRLSDIACAMGLSQLRKLGSNLARRREIAERYNSELSNLPLIRPIIREGVNPAWHLYPIRLELPRLTVDRGQVFRALRAENIGVNVHYIPVHLHPYYREHFGDLRGTLPVAEQAYEQLITLPLFHGMSDQDVSDVVTATVKVLTAYTV
jgi:perosamine synthetase